MTGAHGHGHDHFEGEALGPWEPLGEIDLVDLDLPTKVLGTASLALFVCLQLPWYTRRGALAGSASAMVAGGWRWLIWLLSLAIVVVIFLESVTSLHLPAVLTNPRQRAQILAGAAGLDLLFVFIAAFAAKAQPPALLPVPAGTGVGTAIGAYLGLVAAIVAAGAAAVGLRAAQAVATHPIATPRAAAPPAGAPPPATPPAGRSSRMAPTTSPVAGGPARPQRPADPGSDPPTGWMPPLPPPPPPL